MKTGYRYLVCLVLGAAIIAPGAMTTVAVAQDDQHQNDQRHDNQRNNEKRVYDRSHKDYHNWNDNEDRAYHQYFQEQNKAYRDYSKQSRTGRDQYWNWRHDHPDVQDKH